MRGIVFASAASVLSLAGRSERSLLSNGVELSPSVLGEEALACFLETIREPVLLLQSGCWLTGPFEPTIPTSATGLPLCAFGKTTNDEAWKVFASSWRGSRPVPRCLYLEPAAAHRLCGLLRVHGWAKAVTVLLKSRHVRRVYLPELDHVFDSSLRVLQICTTIQIGGAERVTLDLAESLTKNGHRVWVGALSRPPRKAYPEPKGFIDLSGVDRAPEARAQAIAKIARDLHLDLVHAHLISGAECEALYATGIPLVVTMHNMPQSWPRGFESNGALLAHLSEVSGAEIKHRKNALSFRTVRHLKEVCPQQHRKADLLIACSKLVGDAIATANLGSPCRTAWNGIAAGRYCPSEKLLAEAAQWRVAQGWSENDLVVISVANPRKQKQLERIPEIIARLVELCPDRKVRCVLAGETAPTSADGISACRALAEAIERWSMKEHILRIGGSHNIPVLLAASNVFLSTSSFEGLSLAQLEALAAGLPIVTTDVGGAVEIALEMRGDERYYQRLPVDASAEAFAHAIHTSPAGERRSRLPKAFHRERMAARVEQLYHVTLAMRQRETRKGDGLWILTNNFSMGGAQSSARRLLARFKAEGINVRAITFQEETPTRGSQALAQLEIPVTHVSPKYLKDPVNGVQEVLALAGVNPPEAVVFWNLISSFKMLLVDGLEGIRIYDVSPGEMYFSSLQAYFEKPRPELPYRNAREYGAQLAGMVVKFAREKAVAEEQFGMPVAVIRNGVELQARCPRPNGTKIIFGTAARISPDKRIEDLIEAFSIAHDSLPPYELHIAGKIEIGADGYARDLRKRSSPLPIVWRGELPGTSSFLQELDIFVMISEPAGCPNASLEAMAAGLPVIATDVGGAHEQILDGVTGRLVPRRDNAALANAIVQLASDREAQVRYGANAKARIQSEFSLDAMAESYRALCLPTQSAPQQQAVA